MTRLLGRPCVVSAVCLTLALHASSQTQQAAQQPTFRGGTNLVQVDAILTDGSGRPIDNLIAADFDVLDDGSPVVIDRVRFLGATAYEGDGALAPIRTHDDEEREASRDDVRVYAILLDDYHIDRLDELRVIDPLLAFVQALPSTDLIAVYYPLDSVTDVRFARDRGPALKAIRDLIGRRGDYTPKHPVENEHLRLQPADIERVRRQITASALEGLATHLGGLKQGRKTVLFVSEGFVQPIDELQDVFQAASRANVAIYPVDPRGMTTAPDRGPTRAQALAMVSTARDVLRTLAVETGGRAIVDRNDIRGGLDQVVRDATAYYLVAYESPHPDDGKFHRVTVRVKRPRAVVFARPGYWASKRGADAAETVADTPAVAPAVQQALNRLADSLRPNADEPPEPRRRINIPPPAVAVAPAMLLAPPTVALVRGRTIGDAVDRREFQRTNTLLIRAVTTGQPAVTARLLDRFGRRLTELSVAVMEGAAEVRLLLGSLGPGDYLIELSALGGTEAAQQLVAFRVVR